MPYCRTVADVLCILSELGMPGLEDIKLEFILRLQIILVMAFHSCQNLVSAQYLEDKCIRLETVLHMQ